MAKYAGLGATTTLRSMGDDGPSAGHDEQQHSDQQHEREQADEREAARAQVSALLAAAGLEPPPTEVDRLAGLYPGLRRSIDRFHQIDAGDDVTAAVFRAADIVDPDDGGRTGA